MADGIGHVNQQGDDSRSDTDGHDQRQVRGQNVGQMKGERKEGKEEVSHF